MKYLTIGTNEITVEKFRPIQDSKDSIKPTGGLWLTEQKNEPEYENFNKWVDFILYRKHIFFYKYYNHYKWNIPCSLVTLNNDSNIFVLDKKEKLQFLMENYKSNNLFTFEGLSNNYDGIFIKLLAMEAKEIDREISKKIHTFAVDTLLLFNPNCIDYYQEGNVEIEPFDPDVYLEEPLYKIKYEKERMRVLKR